MGERTLTEVEHPLVDNNNNSTNSLRLLSRVATEVNSSNSHTVNNLTDKLPVSQVVGKLSSAHFIE